MVPIVKYKIAEYEDNLKFLNDFVSSSSETLDFNKYICDLFPRFKELNNISNDEKMNILKEEFDREWDESEHLFIDDIKKCQDIWDKINDIYMEELSKYLNISWPDDINEIIGEIGLFPVFPRYLEKHKFSFYPGLTEERIINVTAHEILHFLWFYKWKSMHPDFIISDSMPQDNIWKYSEIVVDPILNNEYFKNILGIDIDIKTYDIFYDMEYKDENVVEHLRNIYKENIPIEERIEKGFIYFNEVLENI